MAATRRPERRGREALVASVLSLAGGVAIAFCSFVMGFYVEYPQFLAVFETLADAALMLGLLSLAAALWGLWRSRGRDRGLIAAGVLATLLLAWLALNR